VSNDPQAGGTHVDARGAIGVMIGEGNLQINYFQSYDKRTWSDGVAPPPLVSVRGTVDSPYRGLSAFRERDAPFFFGREDAATSVLDRMSRCLTEPGLLIVSGTSGAGKSSLLRAGVLPRLRGYGLASAPGSEFWTCLFFTPGPAPLAELGAQLERLASGNPSQHDFDPEGFTLAARRAAVAQPDGPAEGLDDQEPAPRRLLLIVDQFEQLFTQCPDEQQRQAFIAALHAAATERHGPEQVAAAVVVLGVRADFEARCASYPPLAAAVQDRYLLMPMTRRELRLAITGPAGKRGSAVEDELVDVLLRDVMSRPSAASPGDAQSGAGVLPLLSYALDQSWRSRIGPVLTLTDYARTGGIERAVAASAQATYDGLTAAQQRAARLIFTRLTATSRDGLDIASRATRAELSDGKSPAGVRDVTAVLEAFAAERLLILAADFVEIAHEVLLTAWPLLHDVWLAETHADRTVRSRLHYDAVDWDRDRRHPSHLYSGHLRETAGETAARIDADPARYPPLSQLDRDFLRASDQAKIRRTRRRRGLFAALTALVVVAAVVTDVAIREGNTANSANHAAVSAHAAAVSGDLIQDSQALGTTDPVMARLDSIAAWRIDPTAQAWYAMLSAATLPGLAILPSSAPVQLVAISPDGKTLAVCADGTVQLVDLAIRKPVAALTTDDCISSQAYYSASLAFSPDGETLVADDQLWDVGTRKLIATLNVGGPPMSAAFSPNGKILAIAVNDDVELWNVATRKLTATLNADDQVKMPSFTAIGMTYSVAFSSDGKTLAAGTGIASTNTGTVRVWDLATGKPTATFKTSGRAQSVAFSPDGMTLAAGTTTLPGGGNTGAVLVWDLTTREQTESLTAAGPVYSVAFSPDGNTLAAGTRNPGNNGGTVQLWAMPVSGLQPAANGQPAGIAQPTTYTASGMVNSIAFSPDGKALVAGTEDATATSGTVQLWNAALVDGNPLGPPFSRVAAIGSAVVSPDGTAFAASFGIPVRGQIGNDVGGSDVRVWDLATGRQTGSVTVDGEVSALALSPDGKTLAGEVEYASGDTDMLVWDPATGRQIAAFPADGSADSTAFSPDGKVLAAATQDARGGDEVQVWDLAARRQIAAFAVGGELTPVVALSPDGRTLAADVSTLQLWDLAAPGQRPATMKATGGTVESLAFSPDGKTLAIGAAGNGAAGTVQLWDVATRELITTVVTTGAVSSLAFSPDGETLAFSAQNDDPRAPDFTIGTVQLWDVATGQQIGNAITSNGVVSLAFTRDAKTLTAGSLDFDQSAAAQQWDVTYLADPVSYLCAQAAGTLSRYQWTQDAQGLPYQDICP